MNEDMIRELVLDLQRKSVEERVARVSPACIDVVCRESNFFPLQFIIQHQQSSIEEVELVVP